MQKSDTGLILEEEGAGEISTFRLAVPRHGGSTLELLNPGTNELVVG